MFLASINLMFFGWGLCLRSPDFRQRTAVAEQLRCFIHNTPVPADPDIIRPKIKHVFVQTTLSYENRILFNALALHSLSKLIDTVTRNLGWVVESTWLKPDAKVGHYLCLDHNILYDRGYYYDIDLAVWCLVRIHTTPTLPIEAIRGD